MNIFIKIKDWYKGISNIPLFDLILITIVAMLVSVWLSRGDKVLGVCMYLILSFTMYSICVEEEKNTKNDRKRN